MKQLTDSGTKLNNSTLKTMYIIEVLADNRTPMRLSEISKKLDMNASTTLRFLNTLIEGGYVIQEQVSLRYQLTLKFCSISSKIDKDNYLRDISRPYLIELAEEFNQCICLAVEHNMEIVYIDVIQGVDKVIRSDQRIGNSASMHSTGIGKLFFLNYSEEQLYILESIKGFTKYTDKTISSHAELMETLEQVRKNDYAFDNEECEIGGKCIAVPIRDYTNNVVAGISVSGTVFFLTEDLINSKKHILISAAKEISRKMGYQAV